MKILICSYTPDPIAAHVPDDCEAAVMANERCSHNPIVMSCMSGNGHACEDIETGPPASVMADCADDADISRYCDAPNGDMVGYA